MLVAEVKFFSPKHDKLYCGNKKERRKEGRKEELLGKIMATYVDNAECQNAINISKLLL